MLRRTAAIALAATLVAGPIAPVAEAQDRGKVLRVALVQEIDHLNPFLASFASSIMVGRMTWEYLTPPSAEDNTPSPALATSWRASDDKLTWTFSIRRGIKWSDGQALTAKDIAYTYNRIMTDKVAQEANGSYVENFDTVTAPDEATLVIKTRKPQASMTAIDIPVVPEHVWSGIAKTDDPVTDSLAVVGVGDGPFVITEYRPNQLIRLKANPDYWRGRGRRSTSSSSSATPTPTRRSTRSATVRSTSSTGSPRPSSRACGTRPVSPPTRRSAAATANC